MIMNPEKENQSVQDEICDKSDKQTGEKTESKNAGNSSKIKKSGSDKQKRILIIFSIVAIAFTMIAIYISNYDSFSKFFDKVSDVIAVLNSVFIGIAIAYLLNPVYKFFSNKIFKKMKSGKGKKVLSIILTYVLLIGFISGFFFITVPQIVKSLNEMPAKLHEFASEASVQLQSHLETLKNSDFYKSLIEMLGLESFDIEEVINNFMKRILNIENLVQKIADSALGIVGNVYTVIKDILIGLILSIYLLASKDMLKAQSKKIVYATLGKEKGKNSIELFSFVDKTFGGFIQGKIINAIIIAILTFIAFLIFGIPYPQLLTIIVAVTDLIPVFGPFIGAVPCAFIVLIAAPTKLIPMLLLILIIQQLDGNYIGPKILGESTGISALGVFLAVIIMGGYFGIPGMLLGIPIFAVASTLIQKAVDRKLNKNGMSTDITDYGFYDINPDKKEKKSSLFTRIVEKLIQILKSCWKSIVGFFKNPPKIRKRTPEDKAKAKKEGHCENSKKSDLKTTNKEDINDSNEPN